MSYEEQKCPYCKTENALRYQNTGEKFLDLGIDIAKTVNPVGIFKLMGRQTTSIFKSNFVRSYKVCKQCGGFSYFCSKCDNYTKLPFRPEPCQRIRCGDCGDVQIYERR
ncbi:hypothetical protein IQ255_20225 [Pleurocapsales cyanobacterium LEGE 10410]|nr:hypothetical protein [Pleurocapsales cyanobacterium LEGE 10410]